MEISEFGQVTDVSEVVTIINEEFPKISQPFKWRCIRQVITILEGYGS